MKDSITYIHADPNVLIAIKPPGLPTTYKNESDNSDCLIKYIIEDHPGILKVKGFNPREGGLIYRLDNDTSGIVVVAKNQKTFDTLLKAQTNNQLAKYYYAICEIPGKLSQDIPSKQPISIIPDQVYQQEQLQLPESFSKIIKCPQDTTRIPTEYSIITYPIGHSRKSSKKMIAIKNRQYKSRGKPRPATTYFREICRKDNLALIEAIITKGTRHQIRIHLNAIGIKIAGDNLYNSKSQLQLTNERMFLHCGKVILLKSPLNQN